jgi:hypothetical protein
VAGHRDQETKYWNCTSRYGTCRDLTGLNDQNESGMMRFVLPSQVIENHSAMHLNNTAGEPNLYSRKAHLNNLTADVPVASLCRWSEKTAAFSCILTWTFDIWGGCACVFSFW